MRAERERERKDDAEEQIQSYAKAFQVSNNDTKTKSVQEQAFNPSTHLQTMLMLSGDKGNNTWTDISAFVIST